MRFVPILAAASIGLLTCVATANAQGMNGGQGMYDTQSPNTSNMGHPKMPKKMYHSRMYHSRRHSMMRRHDEQ